MEFGTNDGHLERRSRNSGNMVTVWTVEMTEIYLEFEDLRDSAIRKAV